jgi:lipopolysaccharide/colanic/teichoic acid biosynthesis glycosyltransferase
MQTELLCSPLKADLYYKMSPLVARPLALLLLLVTLPVLIPAMVLLAIDLSESPIFTQLRPGLRGKLFRLYKLKTMRTVVGPDGHLLPDHERISRVGNWVRKLSMDELPQLWNIVRGDMAFVGPRPLLPEYLPLYSEEQMRRHDVLPGITGLAQVSGRNAISWGDKFALDSYYVDNKSLWLDLKIIFKTVGKTLAARDINASSSVPMPKFDGSN